MDVSQLVSIVIPVFNEEDAIAPFLKAMAQLDGDVRTRFAGKIGLEIVFVDDGSTDATLAAIRSRIGGDLEIRAIELSRNFGKEAALTAGLAEAAGQAVIPIDVDLQDPPGLIGDMIALWLDGAKVVLARRTDRSEDGAMKRRTAGWFYAFHNMISDIRIPANVGDFRLMDREVVNAVNQLPESRRFMKGIFAWVGYEPVYVDYARQPRSAGASKFSGWKLWRFAVEGITSFSEVPLMIWTYVGFVIALLSMIYASFIVLRTVVFGIDVPGYASLLTGILFLGGIQILGIGIIGEYIGRIYAEVKRRPTYVIAARHARPAAAPAPAKTRTKAR